MSSRSNLIHKAASLPVGNPERKKILARLTKSAKVEMFMRRPGTISVDVRVRISAGTVGDVIGSAKMVLDQIERSLKGAKDTLEAEGAWVDPASVKVPHVNLLGLSVGRAGLIVAHYWYFAYESPPPTDDESNARYGNQVIKALRKAFKANGIRV